MHWLEFVGGCSAWGRLPSWDEEAASPWTLAPSGLPFAAARMASSSTALRSSGQSRSVPT
eukprot:6237787-Lingulodinium_polyedra.AAC.1